jgi:type III secretion protein J
MTCCGRIDAIRPVLSNGYRFLVFLSFLLLLASCESRRTIVNGLDEKEANEIVVFLSTRGINVNKVRSAEAAGPGGAQIPRFDISVKEDQATEAMSLLNQSGLPRRRGQSLLGLFANVGLVPSEMQDKIRYQAGLGEQIASTLRKIDGVLDAEVQISFPEEDPLRPEAEKKPITASVYIKHSGVLDDPNAHLITKIKRLVAASITGLDFDNVTVIGDRARFSEFPSGVLTGTEEERQYVTVWNIVVAQDSLFRFRLLFFTFTLLLLALLLSLIWLLWKLLPLLKQYGGIKELFHLHPIATPPPPAAEVKEEGKEEAAPEAQKKQTESSKQGLVDEDIDET